MADFDSSGRPDFLQMTSAASPVLSLTHDPVISPGGGVCQSTPVPGTWVGGAYSTCSLANLNGDAFPDVLVNIGNGEAVLDAFGDGTGDSRFPEPAHT